MPKNAWKNNPLTQTYEAKAKNLLKGELKHKGLTYADLAGKLDAIGVQETERNLANKISRGGFTAAFLIRFEDAMLLQRLRVLPWLLPPFVLYAGAVYAFFGLYKSRWRFA